MRAEVIGRFSLADVLEFVPEQRADVIVAKNKCGGNCNQCKQPQCKQTCKSCKRE